MFIQLSVNFICFAWLVHCSLLYFIGAHHHLFVVFFCCSIDVLCWCLSCFCCCSLCFIIHQLCCCLSCFVGGHRCLCDTFYWWSSMPPHCTCWCSLLSSCCVLLEFIIAPMLCFVGVRQHPLLHFVDVCHGLLVVFFWCSSSPPCYTMLVLISGFLMCFTSVHLLHYVGAC